MKNCRFISKIFMVCLLALAIMIGACGCTLFDYADNKDDVPLATPIKVEYQMYKVIRGNIIRSFSATCTVTSTTKNIHKYAFTTGGTQLKEYSVRSGDKVEKGDTLAILMNGETLVADAAGYVRYINSAYSKIKTDQAIVQPGEVMVIVDTENIKYAEAVMTVEREVVQGYSIGVKSTVSLAKIQTGGKQGEAFEAKVTGSSDLADAWSQTVTYYISLKNAPDDIEVGDKLSVTFTEDEKAENCLMIPVSALYSFEDRHFVYVLDSQGLKRECYVEIGLKSDSFVEIKSGLELGQQIIQF